MCVDNFFINEKCSSELLTISFCHNKHINKTDSSDSRNDSITPFLNITFS